MKNSSKSSKLSHKQNHGNAKVIPVEYVHGNGGLEDYDPSEEQDIPIITATPILSASSQDRYGQPEKHKKGNHYGNQNDQPPHHFQKEKSINSNLSKSKSNIGSMSHDEDVEQEFAEFMKRKQSKLGGEVVNFGHGEGGVVNNLPKAWPLALRKKIVESLRLNPNSIAADKYLSQFNWPSGLKETVYKSCKKLPLRFFIVDDSGSMIAADGRRLVKQGNQTRLIKCTRWAELTESMSFLAELSEALQVPSEFRLLNGAEPIIVGLNDDQGESLKFLREVMAESPAGPTPLCMHIEAVVQSIQSVERELRANGQKAVVVIATDGESSDGNVAEALRPLTNLPVLVIVRLCTEEQQVVDYWNNIDNQIELDIDVIDDQLGDAKQVNEVNGWLTYGEPIHRLREFGASMKELDVIDESTLSSDQMRGICSYLFCNGDLNKIPHPGVEWRLFIKEIKNFNNKSPPVFCPISQTMKPWVDPVKLSKFYIAESSAASGGCSLS